MAISTISANNQAKKPKKVSLNHFLLLNIKILLKIKINVDAAKTPTAKKKKSDFPKSNQAVDEKGV